MTWKPTIRSGGRPGVLTAAATAGTVTGTLLLALGLTSHVEPPPLPEEVPRGPAARSSPSPEASQEPRADHDTVLPASPPTRIEIPGIGLEADVEPVALNEAGAVAMPGDVDHAGWYTGSPSPGSRGNSIVVGHVDSHTGPAAFYGLGAVEDGGRITIEREDGRAAVYVVDGMHVWSKDDFPSERVYGPTAGPQLTLLTCADWNDEQQDYLSNLVVTAHVEKESREEA